MTEPASAFASAAAAGAGAVALASLGIEPAPMFWALAGAVLGLTFAPAASRMRFWSTFVCVVLASSVFGAWLAQRYVGGEPLSRNAFACLMAIGFHPGLNVFITSLPVAFNAAVNKWLGIGSKP